MDGCWAPDSGALLLMALQSKTSSGPTEASPLGPGEAGCQVQLLLWSAHSGSQQLSALQSLPDNPPFRHIHPPLLPLHTRLAMHLPSCSGLASCQAPGGGSGQTSLSRHVLTDSGLPVSSSVEPLLEPMGCPQLLAWLQEDGQALGTAGWELQKSYRTGTAARRHPGLMAPSDMSRFAMSEGFSRDGAFRAAATLEGTVCVQDHSNLQLLHTWGDSVHGARALLASTAP